MKATRYIAAIALLAGLVACEREKDFLVDEPCTDGFVEVTISTSYPEAVAVPTRSPMGEGADPDEFDLYLCLYGPGEGFFQNWIPTTRVNTVLDTKGYVQRIDYRALLPVTDEKRVVHLVVNPPIVADPTLTGYIDNVMEQMVDTDKECSYWQEVILPNGIQASTGDDGKLHVIRSSVEPLLNVTLVRNFAKLIVTSPDEFTNPATWVDPETPEVNPLYEGFTVKRWTIINVPTHGYVAPYTGIQNEAKRFPMGYRNIASYTGSQLYKQLTGTDEGQDDYKGSFPADATIDDSFPGDPENAEYASLYVNRNEPLYLYERPLPTSSQKQTSILAEIEFDPGHALNPSETDPVSYWYKIEVLNDKGDYVPFLRAIVYELNIQGVESVGEATAEEAYNGPYFGNISASLETSSLNELSNGTSLVHVDQMDYTFLQGSTPADPEAGTEAVTRTELLMFGSNAARFYFVPFIAGNEELEVPAGQTYTETTAGICEVKVELMDPPAGHEAAVTSIIVNDPEVGEGTIQVVLAETSATAVKKSVIRVSGKAEGGKEIYRDITVNLMSQQEFAHGSDVTRITVQPDDLTTCGINKTVTIRLQLPEDLGASLFPIQVRIEAENNVLSATSQDLPVVTGKSVFDPNRNTFFYVRTIKYSDYCTLNKKTKKYEYHYYFDCTFQTTKTGDNTSWIDVRDMKGEENFRPVQLALGTPTTPEP